MIIQMVYVALVDDQVIVFDTFESALHFVDRKFDIEDREWIRGDSENTTSESEFYTHKGGKCTICPRVVLNKE